MTSPVTTCALVAAICLSLGGFILAAVLVCAFCFLFEFLLPGFGTLHPTEVPAPDEDLDSDI